MKAKPSLPSQRRFAQDGLYWLVAVVALVIYSTTLNHWVTLNSISLAAKVAGWDWLPIVAQPALFLATLPCRWLPTSWVPLALNAGAAVCAALTLALLAWSVSLLPHDRIDAEQRLADNEHMGRFSGQSGAGLEELGARGSTVWGAKLGSDRSPRRGRRIKGQSRGTAGRVILQASPVTLPAERAVNLHLRTLSDFPGHGCLMVEMSEQSDVQLLRDDAAGCQT